MRLARGLLSPSALCLALGVAGGLLLGYLLSRRGGWMTPAPWAIYFVALLVAIAAVSWLDERRRPRAPVQTEPPADGAASSNVLEFPTERAAAGVALAASTAVPGYSTDEASAPHECADREVGREC